METKKTKSKDVPDFVAKIVGKVFKESLPPKETDKNLVLVGSEPISYASHCLYQPHNYRLYFDFERTGFNWQNLPLDVGFRVINSSEVFLDDFMDCSVRVRKSTVQITNKVNHKKWFKIDLSNVDLIRKQVEDIIVDKDLECIEVLKAFIKRFGGRSNFMIRNRHSEDKVMGERAIEKLPIQMAFHSDVVKKVYKEGNVEFSNPSFAVTYLRNRSVEDVAPEIAKSLDAVAVQQKRLSDEALIPLTAQIKLHLEVMQDMKNTLRDIRNAQMGARFESHATCSSTSFSSHSENVEGVTNPRKFSNNSFISPSTYPFHKALNFIKRRRLK